MKVKKIIAAVVCAAVVAVVPTFAACGETTYINVYQSDSPTASEIIEALWEKYQEEMGEDASYADFLAYYSELSTSAAVGKCLLSSMKVYAEFIEKEDSSGNNMVQGNQNSKYVKNIYTGGAVIYSMDYSDDGYTYVITNYHVVYDSSADEEKNGGNKTLYNKVAYGYLYGSEGTPTATGTMDINGYTVYDYGDYVIELEYVGGSVSADIAVLRVKTSEILKINEKARAVDIADSYSVGDTAIAIGNPNGAGISVTKGIVSVVDEYINLKIDETTRSYRSIRIDTAIYSGNSGGGLFNADGELIGLANAGDSDDENINYAVPIEIVTGVADSIIDYADGYAYTVDWGLSLSSQDSKYVYDYDTGTGAIVENVVVSSVESSSIGSELGLEEGDIIKELVVISGEKTTTYSITRTFNLSDIGYTLRVGDVIYFEYERGSVTVCDKNTTYTLDEDDFKRLS